MSLFFRVSGIVTILALFFGAGLAIGEHRFNAPIAISSTYAMAPEGTKKVNSTGDHVVVHNGVWVLDTKQ